MDAIDMALSRCPFKVGDKVQVKERVGTVIYVYYNGFVLLDFGTPITGGIFNNNSTYRWEEVRPN